KAIPPPTSVNDSTCPPTPSKTTSSQSSTKPTPAHEANSSPACSSTTTHRAYAAPSPTENPRGYRGGPDNATRPPALAVGCRTGSCHPGRGRLAQQCHRSAPRNRDQNCRFANVVNISETRFRRSAPKFHAKAETKRDPFIPGSRVDTDAFKRP